MSKMLFQISNPRTILCSVKSCHTRGRSNYVDFRKSRFVRLHVCESLVHDVPVNPIKACHEWYVLLMFERIKTYDI